MAWDPGDWIAFAGVIVSPLGAIAVVFLTGRQRGAERTASERERIRAQSAIVLGPVLVLLNDVEPRRLAFRASSGTPLELYELRKKWNELRPQLGIMGATDPRWSQAALRLVVAIDNSLYSAERWVKDLVAGGTHSEEYEEAAVSDHRETMQQATELVSLVWKSAGGRGEALEYPAPPARDEGVTPAVEED